MHDFFRIYCGLCFCVTHHFFHRSRSLSFFVGLIGLALGVGVGDDLLGSGGGVLHGGLCLGFRLGYLGHCIQSHGFTAFPVVSVGARCAIILMPGIGYFTAW